MVSYIRDLVRVDDNRKNKRHQQFYQRITH
jgi:hypothetical protein